MMPKSDFSSERPLFIDRVSRLQLDPMYAVGQEDPIATTINNLDGNLRRALRLVDMRNPGECEISSLESSRRLMASKTLVRLDARMAFAFAERQDFCPSEWEVEGLNVVFAGTPLHTAWGTSYYFMEWNGRAYDLKIGPLTDLLGTYWTAKFVVWERDPRVAHFRVI